MFTKNELPQFYFGEGNTSIEEAIGRAKNTDEEIIDFQELNTSKEKITLFEKNECSTVNICDIQSEPNLSRIPSPTSSITSNKKLEWDSGADIGYNIFDSLKNSKRSKSYPLLTIHFSALDEVNKFNEVDDTRGTKKLIDNETDTSNSRNFLCSVDMDKNKKQKKKTFQHSTPNENILSTSQKSNPVQLFSIEDKNNTHVEPDIKNEPSLQPHSDQCIQTQAALLPSSVSNLKNKKSSEEGNTSSSSNSKSFEYLSHKELQNRKSLKDEEDSSVTLQVKQNEKINKNVKVQINVKCNKSSQTDISFKNESKTSNNTTLSITTLASCSEKSQSSSSTSNTFSSSSSSKRSKKSLSKSNLSDNIPLGEMISTQHSSNLIEDIDRSLYILQKFIKSKQYNPVTKKYFAKKIVTKIIQSKYSDDTSSSEGTSESSTQSNSATSCNKKRITENTYLASTREPVETQDKSYSSSEDISRTESNSNNKKVDTLFVRNKTRRVSSSTENESQSKKKMYVDTATQYDIDITEEKIIQSSGEKNIECLDKSTSYDSDLFVNKIPDEIIEKNYVSCAIQCDDIQYLYLNTNENTPSNAIKKTHEDISTDSNQEAKGILPIDLPCSSPELIDSTKSVDDEKTNVDFVKKLSHSSTEEHYKNWRDEKTVSERLYEAKKMYYSLKKMSNKNLHAQGDKNVKTTLDVGPSTNYLLQYSKREKRRQLSWISDEIEHLRALKKLLETKEYTSNTSTSTFASQHTKTSLKSDFSHNQKNESSGNASNSQISISNDETSLNSTENCLANRRTPSATESSDAISENGLKKLSKYFTNEQLKNLIQDNTSTPNCTCLCCRYKGKLSKYKALGKSIPHIKKNENQASEVQLRNAKSLKKDSIVDKSCQVSNTSTLRNKVDNGGDKPDEVTEKSKNYEMRDADIQCTIRKHKSSQKDTTKDTSDSTLKSNETTVSNARDQSDNVIFDNMNNFDSLQTMVTSTTVSSDFTYLRKQSSVSSAYSTSDKENRAKNFNKKCYDLPNLQNHTKSEEPTKPLAYMLTFEEESLEENGYLQNANKNSLEKVTVKVPKLKSRPKLDKKTANKSNSKLTLQEYLSKNRPDFVEAAEYRRKCVSDAKETHNVFTCREMKQITLKQYKKLPEVKDKVKQQKIDHERRNNRLHANIFSKKLQKKTLQGQISLSTCISIMSPL